jgi:hypothetical protein
VCDLALAVVSVCTSLMTDGDMHASFLSQLIFYSTVLFLHFDSHQGSHITCDIVFSHSSYSSFSAVGLHSF